MRAYRMTIRFYQGADGAAERKPAQAQAPGRARDLAGRAPRARAAGRGGGADPGDVPVPDSRPGAEDGVHHAGHHGDCAGGHQDHEPAARGPSGLPESWRGFAATAIAAMAAFCIAPMMSNIFGLDRNGFRALVLLPARRDYILLAKNLSCAPFAALIAVVLLGAVKFVARLPWEPVLGGLLQAGGAFLMFCLLGNMTVHSGALSPGGRHAQAKKPKPAVFIAMFAMMLVTPLIAVPLALPAGLQLVCSFFNWAPWLPVNLAASLCLLVATAAHIPPAVANARPPAGATRAEDTAGSDGRSGIEQRRRRTVARV